MVSRIFSRPIEYTETAGSCGGNLCRRRRAALENRHLSDVLLLVNFLAGYFLLLGAGVLSGCSARLTRLLAASGLAALSALILFAPELPYPVQILYKLAAAPLIVWVAFGYRGPRRFLCGVFWYVTLNLLLAGLALLAILQAGVPFVQTNNLAVYLRVPPLLLLLLAGLCCLAVEIAMRFLGRSEKPAENIGVELELSSTKVCLRAALDTGCHLKGPHHLSAGTSGELPGCRNPSARTASGVSGCLVRGPVPHRSAGWDASAADPLHHRRPGNPAAGGFRWGASG